MADDYDDDDAAGTPTGGDLVTTSPSPPLRLYETGPALATDPSEMGWPPTMIIELALKVGSPKDICADHGISREQWEAIRHNPVFIAELGRTVEALRTDGMAFKARSQLQANELLKESWKLIHDVAVPANVRADLIKSTIRWSGLDASKDAALQAKTGAGFSIQINLL